MHAAVSLRLSQWTRQAAQHRSMMPTPSDAPGWCRPHRWRPRTATTRALVCSPIGPRRPRIDFAADLGQDSIVGGGDRGPAAPLQALGERVAVEFTSGLAKLGRRACRGDRELVRDRDRRLHGVPPTVSPGDRVATAVTTCTFVRLQAPDGTLQACPSLPR